jgi:hypothetical protein
MLLTLLLTASLLTDSTDRVRAAPSGRNLKVLPLPLVYYTPETRLAYGGALAATFRVGTPPDSAAVGYRPSQVTLGAAYTQNRQVLFYVPFQVFVGPSAYYFVGEVGYYRYTYFFYGFGQQEVPAELFGVDFPRIRLNGFRRIGPVRERGQLFAGLRYQYEAYRLTATEPGGLLASGRVPGGAGSRLSGVGLGIFYDARDQVFYPRRGAVVDLTYLHHAPGLGGTVRFDRYVADVATYHALSSRLVLALNYVASFTVGEAPFNALTLLGGTRRLRGYYEGRFRDRHAGLVQSELRFDIYKRLGVVLFGGLGVLGDERQLLRFREPKAAGGAGLRFTFNRRDHLNIRLDYGLGQQMSGLYLTIGEAF